MNATDVRLAHYRNLVAQYPCTGERGCEPIDVDALPAVRGVISGKPLSAEPCDNCQTVEFQCAAHGSAR